jgi:hypothetical protein
MRTEKIAVKDLTHFFCFCHFENLLSFLRAVSGDLWIKKDGDE